MTAETVGKLLAALEAAYPDAACSLDYGGDPFRLLCMALLSAQCTDKRVNLTAPALFAAYPTPEAMAQADPAVLEALVRPCGLYQTKAKHLRALSAILAEQGGTVPSDMDALLALPGVGRKIANLIRGDLFHLPGIVTDTHCIRVCGRLGFYPESLRDPLRVERILSPLIPPPSQSDFCHRLVLLGREFCSARSPKCGECPVREICARGGLDEVSVTRL